MTNRQNSTTFDDAFSKLAQGLEARQAIKVGSFWEFVRDIWSQSFDHPEYFQAWHVGVVAEDLEKCLEEGLNYVAILPRFHFKSTILGHAFSVWRLLKANRDCSVLYLSYSDHMARYHLSEINKTVKIDAPVVGDIDQVLNLLNPKLNTQNHTDWLKQVEHIKAEHPSLLIPESDSLL